MATDVFTPQQTVTYTITTMPRREAERKTILRLMQMQPDTRRTLKKLSRQRRTKDNRPYIRAGVLWVDRAKATRPVRVEAGASFTLELTPQILLDLRSVEKYLQAKPA
jgi:hypothetical protein